MAAGTMAAGCRGWCRSLCLIYLLWTFIRFSTAATECPSSVGYNVSRDVDHSGHDIAGPITDPEGACSARLDCKGFVLVTPSVSLRSRPELSDVVNKGYIKTNVTGTTTFTGLCLYRKTTSCLVSDWSAWGPCVLGKQMATRSVIKIGSSCPLLVRIEECSSNENESAIAITVCPPMPGYISAPDLEVDPGINLVPGPVIDPARACNKTAGCGHFVYVTPARNWSNLTGMAWLKRGVPGNIATSKGVCLYTKLPAITVCPPMPGYISAPDLEVDPGMDLVPGPVIDPARACNKTAGCGHFVYVTPARNWSNLIGMAWLKRGVPGNIATSKGVCLYTKLPATTVCPPMPGYISAPDLDVDPGMDLVPAPVTDPASACNKTAGCEIFVYMTPARNESNLIGMGWLKRGVPGNFTINKGVCLYTKLTAPTVCPPKPGYTSATDQDIDPGVDLVPGPVTDPVSACNDNPSCGHFVYVTPTRNEPNLIGKAWLKRGVPGNIVTSKGLCRYTKLPGTKEAYAGQLYTFFKPAVASNPSWMRTLCDDLALSQLSIPGTHDTMTGECRFGYSCYPANGPADLLPKPVDTVVAAFVQTQSMTLMAQLQSGIRYVDIRFKYDKGEFITHHGGYTIGTNLSEVISILRTFLRQYPSETVLMEMQYSGDSTADRFDSNLTALINASPGLFWNYSSNPRNIIPRLAELRGKVMIIQNFNSPIQFGLNTTFIAFPRSHYELNSVYTAFDMVNEMKSWITNTVRNTNLDNMMTIYSTSISGTITNPGGGSIGSVADLLSKLTGAFCPYPYVCTPFIVATITNTAMLDYLAGLQRSRVGLISADFPGKDLIEKTINLNFRDCPTATAGSAYSHYYPTSTPWGNWQGFQLCKDGVFVQSWAARVEADQKIDDDTAMNAVRMVCDDGTTLFPSAGSWGSYGPTQSCPSGHVIGVALKVESPLAGIADDDTAVNSLQVICSGSMSTPFEIPNAGAWGSWGGGFIVCRPGYGVCGLDLKIEPNQGSRLRDDDTALNSIAIKCCRYPEVTVCPLKTGYAVATDKDMDPGNDLAGPVDNPTSACNSNTNCGSYVEVAATLNDASLTGKGWLKRGVPGNMVVKKGVCLYSKLQEITVCPPKSGYAVAADKDIDPGMALAGPITGDPAISCSANERCGRFVMLTAGVNETLHYSQLGWGWLKSGATSTNIVYKKGLCLYTKLQGNNEPSNWAATITVSDGWWGDWLEVKSCKSPGTNLGQKMTGFQLRIESSCRACDDTALNGLRMTCSVSSSAISVTEGLWGSWTSSASCSSSAYITGARLRLESKQDREDDTAANSIEFKCSDNKVINVGNGTWGDWSPWVTCPADTYVCGAQARFEKDQGGQDDTAFNGLRLLCCSPR